MKCREATVNGRVSRSARLMSLAATARSAASLAGLFGGVTATLTASLLLASPASADTFSVCPSGMSGDSTYDTSCAFADNVRWAWYSQPGSIVTAYSPVTSKSYTMQCTPATTTYWPEAKRCVGVNSYGAGLIVFVDQDRAVVLSRKGHRRALDAQEPVWRRIGVAVVDVESDKP